MYIQSGEWCHWNHHVGEYIYPTDSVPDYTSILVPNVDNTRTSFLLESIAKQRKVILSLLRHRFDYFSFQMIHFFILYCNVCLVFV